MKILSLYVRFNHQIVAITSNFINAMRNSFLGKQRLDYNVELFSHEIPYILKSSAVSEGQSLPLVILYYQKRSDVQASIEDA